MATLYERLGGEPTVDAAVTLFYRNVLADSRVSRFFETVDIERQAKRLKEFLTWVLCGPNVYTGKGMREAHAHLVARGLNETHFNAVIEDLSKTFRELGVAEVDIQEIAGLADSVRDDVLGR